MGKQLNVENSVISAKDDAYFYNAMIQKNGVWQYGNKLEYEIISANQINIKDGMVTAQGRNYVIYPNEVDSLTIENGTVNTQRYDLIVYEVSKTSEGEQVGLKVIKGTNAVTPTDPILIQENTLVSGSKYQMPLYRVRLNGINIEGVDDLREYIVSFGNLVNDNLLINSDFRNPINQRGQTSYNNNAQTWTKVYTIDRWYLNGENGTTLNVGDGYIEIVATKNCWLIQTFEKSIDGKYITTINVLEISGSATYHDIELTSGLNVIDGEGKFNDCGIYLTAGTTIKLEYIKLEQGSIATPFVPRNYGEELVLCQRYYFTKKCKQGVGTLLLGQTYEETKARFPISLPVPLRTIPTLSSVGIQLVSPQGTWSSADSLVMENIDDGTITVNIGRTGIGFTSNMIAFAYIYGGHITFDAEIY